MASRLDLHDLIRRHLENPHNAKSERAFQEFHRYIKKKGYIDQKRLKDISGWKSSRARRYIRHQDPQMVKSISRLALRLKDDEYSTRILLALRGVGTPTASAILSMAYPQRYGVIDRRAWSSLHRLGLFATKKHTFRVSDYVRYLTAIRTIARESNLTPRQVDIALWQYDKESRKKTGIEKTFSRQGP